MIWLLTTAAGHAVARGTLDQVVDHAVEQGCAEYVYSKDGTAKRPRMTERGLSIRPEAAARKRRAA